jgi:hypothetical protein
MPCVNLVDLEPWEFAVIYDRRREPLAFRSPCWEEVLALGCVRKAIEADPSQDRLEESLRSAMRPLLSVGGQEVLDTLQYHDLLVIFTALETYFTGWMARRGAAGLATIGAGPATAGPPESAKPAAKGLASLAPYLARPAAAGLKTGD